MIVPNKMLVDDKAPVEAPSNDKDIDVSNNTASPSSLSNKVTSTASDKPAPLVCNSQSQTSDLFGGAKTSAAFGNTTTQPKSGFNLTKPQQFTFGFPKPQTNSSPILSQPAKPFTLNATNRTAGFGNSNQTIGQLPTSSLFGQPATSTSNFATFGQTAPTTRSIFGQPIHSGTQISKYQPTIGPDMLADSLIWPPFAYGQCGRFHCITAMKDFKEKSLEELRMHYYLKNWKIPSGRFGFIELGDTSPVEKKTDLFNAALFGQPMEEATINKELFALLGYLAFGQPVTSGQNFFGTTNTTGFAPKPAFGQTTAPSLFGQTPSVSTEGLSVRIEETFDRNLQSEKKVVLSRTYIFK